MSEAAQGGGEGGTDEGVGGGGQKGWVGQGGGEGVEEGDWTFLR